MIATVIRTDRRTLTGRYIVLVNAPYVAKDVYRTLHVSDEITQEIVTNQPYSPGETISVK